MNETPNSAPNLKASQRFNARQVLLVSGPVASGKTSLCQLLAQRFGFCVVSTRELIAQGAPDRPTLQAAGALLDDFTAGMWVLEGLLQKQKLHLDSTQFAVDAVRTLEQIRWVRDALGESVIHIHLTAAKETLSKRYESRSERYSYELATNDPIEQGVSALASAANMVIDTTNQCPSGVMDRLAVELALTS